MYASDRCVVSTLAQALDLAERFPADQVGVAVDTYHIWWDDQAPAQIARAGAGGRIHTFQLADWTTPLPEGVLNGRGQIGDGCDRHARVEGVRRGGRLHRPDRGRAVQRRAVGHATAARYWRRRRHGSWNTRVTSRTPPRGSPMLRWTPAPVRWTRPDPGTGRRGRRPSRPGRRPIPVAVAGRLASDDAAQGRPSSIDSSYGTDIRGPLTSCSSVTAARATAPPRSEAKRAAAPT